MVAETVIKIGQIAIIKYFTWKKVIITNSRLNNKDSLKSIDLIIRLQREQQNLKPKGLLYLMLSKKGDKKWEEKK